MDNGHPKEIIGSTVVPELGSLPLRLNPIGRDGDTYFVQLSLAEGGLEHWAIEDGGWIEESFDLEDFHRLDAPVAYRSGYVLLKLVSGDRPEYVPVAEVPARLERAYTEALNQAEAALQRGDAVGAEERTWYAARARQNDPVAVLLLVALLRATTPDEELDDLIRRVPRDSRWPSVARVADSLPSIHQRIMADPLIANTTRGRLAKLKRAPAQREHPPLFSQAA